MKVLFDINHPAHVHFFKNAIKQLRQEGHEIVVTSRIKECATDLLESLNVRHIVLSQESQSGLMGLAKELIQRDLKLLGVVRKEKPDVMAAIGGTFIAHVGFLSRKPSLVFYDTENAKLQNLITYPLASKVIVPECYQAWVPRNKTIRYQGYHELAYLHPNYFKPDIEVAKSVGMKDGEENFLIRVVAWNANHDVGETGWSEKLLRALVQRLSKQGQVIISSETVLPEDMESLRYRGPVEHIHHLMAYCRLYIGESATMASESAVLGVPAIYAAETGRGYTDEQESRYGLVLNVKELDEYHINGAIDRALGQDHQHYQNCLQRLISESVDVNEFLRNQLHSAVQS